MPTKPDKKRSLNLEEKRLLEKLLLGDIGAATSAYSAKRQQERDTLKERLISNVPPEVRALVDERASAEKALQRATEELRERGYGFGGYVLGVTNGVPTWVATTTLSNISGTLAVAKGGTGNTSYGTGDIPFY